MNVGWGFTILFHFFILIIKWLRKKPIHFAIFLFVFIFFSSGFLLLSKTSLVNSNLTYLQNHHGCIKKEINPDKKYIILRLDDIQSSYLRGITIKMINEALSRQIPYTLAVIPLNINKDPLIVNYLRQNKCNLEVAQHGFNNRDDVPEFQDLPVAVADDKLERGLELLSKVTNKKIITFIPPNNVYSTGTSISAKKHNFKVISWEWDWYFDYSASTYDFEKNQLFRVEDVVELCIEESNLKWFSIIMLHPQDYIDNNWNLDENKYSQYIKLLNILESEWFEFTTISTYYNFLHKNWSNINFFDNTILSSFEQKNID